MSYATLVGHEHINLTSVFGWHGRCLGLYQYRPENMHIFAGAGLHIFVQNVYTSTLKNAKENGHTKEQRNYRGLSTNISMYDTPISKCDIVY